MKPTPKEFVKSKGLTRTVEKNWKPGIIYGLMEEYASLERDEKVTNLSELGKTEKDKLILDFIQMTAKNVLSVFVALGLKTHIEATVVNDADGSSYKLSFVKTTLVEAESNTINEDEMYEIVLPFCGVGLEPTRGSMQTARALAKEILRKSTVKYTKK